VAVLDGGRQRGQRRHPGGQYRAAEQGVHQRAFAALGLAGDHHPQPLLGKPQPQVTDLLLVLIPAQGRDLPRRPRQDSKETAAGYAAADSG
jgi:hypothetical protein